MSIDMVRAEMCVWALDASHGMSIDMDGAMILAAGRDMGRGIMPGRDPGQE